MDLTAGPVMVHKHLGLSAAAMGHKTLQTANMQVQHPKFKQLYAAAERQAPSRWPRHALQEHWGWEGS